MREREGEREREVDEKLAYVRVVSRGSENRGGGGVNEVEE